MLIHNKDLQFDVRVERPDPRFATLLQEQFGGANDDLKQATEICDWMPAVAGSDGRDQIIRSVAVNPLHFALSGAGPDVGNSAGAPRTGAYVNSNGEKPFTHEQHSPAS